jgi:(heptosyl)LPS beta-1,4-glucosyltransferase
MFLDKQLNHGANARYVLRLFRRDMAEFSDWEVHEKVILKAGTKPGRLKSRLRHFSTRDFDQMMHKYVIYASLGAKRRFDQGRSGGGLFGASLRAVFVFLQLYIFRLGFLDGGPGFLIAVMHSQYAFNKYAGLWYLNKAGKK